MIQMYHVTKEYGDEIKALDNVNVRIQKGEFVFLIGPSGAGKTTFMKLIFREEVPSLGHVIIDGRSIERLRESKIPYLRRNIGVVFQDFKLLNLKTVFENVAFALRVINETPKKIKERVDYMLEQVGLSDKATRYPNQLSGGEQQRVCIARAIVNEPAILLTDEPTGNLDPQIAHEIMNVLVKIHLKGTTVVVATHNSGIVNQLQKRVIALVKGRVVKDEKRGSYGGF